MPIRNFCQWATIFLALSVSSFVAAAPSLAATVAIRVTIEKDWKLDGSFDYSFFVRSTAPAIISPTPPFVFPSLKITAPDGTVGVSTASNVIATGLSFTDMQSRFLGTWTIQELGPSGAISQFNLLPFTESTFFNEKPTINSPHDGDILPSTFKVNWSFENGGTPNGKLLSYPINSTSLKNTVFAPSTILQATITDTFLTSAGAKVLPPDTFSIRAGSFDSIASYLTPVVPVSGVSANTYNFLTSGFHNLSPVINLTVVPEPSSMVLVGLGIAGLGLTRVRRRKSAC